MDCASCGERLLEDSRFCHRCGTPAGEVCPHCRTSVRPDFAFCPECGGALRSAAPPGSEAAPEPQAVSRPEAAPAPPPAPAERTGPGPPVPTALAEERKQVTVLFCDLAGSTAIAERMDPEEYRDLLDGYLELAIREIDSLGGMVNQLAGDGFMALFGAPIAHEDAPERAVRAALGIQSALDGLNGEGTGANGAELRARIGIHTGPVVVGTVGNDLKMDYTAIGDTTNLAARLQQQAEPGSVLISDVTHDLVAGRFELRALPPVQMKGKSEPVASYEVQGTSLHVTPMGIAAARGLTPLIGMNAELAQLDACFERLGESLPQIVSIVGDPGSGKSRLVYEFRQRLAERDVTVLEARASALSQSVPFAPVSNMLKELFELGAGEDADCACEKIATKLRPWDPKLERIYPPLCQLLTQPEADAEAGQREHIIEALNALLGAMIQERAVVMILEDLHWIDEASLELLERGVARMDRWPVMVIATHRPDFEPGWKFNSVHTRLPLRPLSDEHAARVATARAGGPLPPALERKIVSRAGGNPFFVEEITRSLVEGGQLVREDEGVRLVGTLESIRIPQTVQELIGARLDRLTPATKRAAQMASVLGRQFRADQLDNLLADEAVGVPAALRELEDGGLIHRVSAERGEYRFGESLTQSVCYEGLLLRERRALHERVAALIEADPRGMTTERAGLVAHHLARSENRSRAIESLLAAARSAEDLPSYPSAASLYRQAWELAEGMLADQPGEQSRRWVLDAALGVGRVAVMYLPSERRDEERAVKRACELARSLEDLATLSRALGLHAVMVSSGDGTRFDEGLKLQEKALEVAQQSGQELAVITAQRSLAWSQVRDGRSAEGASGLEAVRRALEKLGQHDPPSDLYLSVGFFRTQAALLEDDLARALELGLADYEACTAADNRTLGSAAMSVLAQVHLELARYPEARDWADRALEAGGAIGNAGASRTGALVGVIARRELGEAVDPGALLKQVEHTVEARGDFSLNGYLVAETLVELGELERARRFADDVSVRAGGRLRQVQSLLVTATVLLAEGPGQLAEAAQEFGLARSVADEVGARSFSLLARLGLARIDALRGDREGAQRALGQIVEDAEAAALPRLRERAQRARAELAEADALPGSIPPQIN